MCTIHVRVGEATSELSTGSELPPVFFQLLWVGHVREKKEQQYQPAQAPPTADGLLLETALLGVLIAQITPCSFCHGGGAGQKLKSTAQPSHTTTVTRFQLSLPSGIILVTQSCTCQAPFAKASPPQLSSCPTNGLSLFYLTFCPLNSTLESFELPSLKLCHSRHQDLSHLS